ncbi:MAG: nickel pincer cofactor biosynthesis protein LarB [Candidatus Altiarchaeota archaeon]|nr:nickel pincer cofactor biosynthesis protein LarB [Candidatus Altiarchaeota archaeon]
MKKILKDLKEGRISAEEAEKLIAEYLSVGDFCKFDFSREHRRGVPEIVLGEGKEERHLLEIAKRVYEKKGGVIITRIDKKIVPMLEKIGPCRYNALGKVAIIGKLRTERKGVVGILTAGTSDIQVAEEAGIIAEEMGCKVIKSYDVGVSGIHRLYPAIKEMKERGAGAIIVVAGMEGALPSVVSGLVDILVIGVPTSNGYGYGGKGEAALMAMLQSCSPGVVVVNIDNGVGAAIAASIVAKNRL